MPKLLNLHDGQVADLAPEPDVTIAHDTDLAAEDLQLSRAKIVAIDFPKFKDGRGFTQARLLRERFGFEGELRACGHVLPDQALFLRRVGVDAVEIADELRLDDFRRGLQSYQYAYQRCAVGQPAFEIRGQRS